MSHTKLSLINGWAHDEIAIRPLHDQLAQFFDVTTTNATPLPATSCLGDPLAETPIGGGSIQGEQDAMILVGWSLGGMLAIQQAIRSPDSIAALVLISSMQRFCVGENFPEGTPMANLRALAVGCRRRLRETLSGFYDQAAWPHPPHTDHDSGPERAQRIATDHRPGSTQEELTQGGVTQGLIQGLDYLRDVDLSDRVKTLSVPTLILHGRDDAVVSLAAADDLCVCIAGSQLLIRDGMGHDLPLRDPTWVTRSITHFWTHHVASKQ